MRKLFTFLLTMVVAMVANAAITPTVQLGDEFTSVADLAGKSFAIVDKAAEKALFGSNNQNLAFDAYGSAFVTTNSGYTWQLESLAENQDESVHGYYLLHLVAPNGTPVPTSDWGGKYLNSQKKDGWCCFNLGITEKKLGQDIDYGAVWDVQFVEGKGFSLKNIGTGLYKGADGGTANKEEAVYFAFAPVSITYVPALKALLAEGEAMKKRGASSADYDAAIEGIDPDKSADALADAQKVEAALPALAKTQLTAGSDFTRAIANFDCAAKDGWTFDKPKGGNGPDHGGDFEYWAGNASNRAEASFDYWQEITGLPNGTYTVSAEMYNSLNNEGGDYTEFKPTVGVYATVGEKTVSKLVDVNSETRVPYVTDAIEVTDGKIRIGAKSFEAPMAARWFTVDNFKLTLVKPAVAPTAPEKDKWFNEIDFCFRDKASTVATSTEKTFAVWGADPDDVTNGCIVATAGKNSSATNAQFWIRGAEYVEPTYIGKDKAQLTAVYDKGGFAKGTGFKVTMRVKADGEYSAGSQTHKAFQHVSNDGFGTLNVTKEWQTVTFVCIADDARAGFTDLCFNLAASDADRTFYFDDIQIVRGSEWYLNCGEIHAKDYQDPKATYADSDDPHPFARFVSDAEGGYVEVITNAARNNPWDSQIWIGIPAQYVGKSTKMTMYVWADKAVKCSESYHATATGKGWGASASPGQGIETTVGQWVEVSRILNTKDVNCNGVYKNMQVDYYCLDLSNDEKGSGTGITYRFKDIKFEAAQEAWYTNGKIIAKDYVKGDETYTNSDDKEFPLARYVYDDKGDYVEVQSNAKRVDEWDSQIWIEIPEAWVGKKVKLTMEVEASKEVTAAAAYHSFAGGNHWGPGAGEGVPFKVGEFTKIERILNTKDVVCNKNQQVKYYVLNLSNDEKGEGTGITYKFKNIAWSEAPVDTWADLIPLQDFEAGYTGADDEKLYFFEKEQEISSEAYRARIVDGVGKDGGKAIEFRYAENAEQGWYSQFEIRLPYLLPNGTKIKLTADIKADKAVSGMGGQVWYNDFGSYRGGIPGYALEADTWYKYEKEITINDGEANDDPKGLRFLVFDGKGGSEANILYFDNISVQIAEDQVPAVDPDFLNAKDYPIFVYVDPRTLDWSENILKNGDLSTDDMREFILKNNDVENPEMLLAEKNQYGEIGIETAARPTNEDGSVGGNDYDAQFFVRLPYVLPKGKKFNLEFDLYAEKLNTLTIAAHGEPGEWKANISSVKTDPSLDAVHYQEYLTAPDDMRTIAFNLAVADATTYGFSNIKVQVVNDDMAAIKAATDAADATSLWAETLALNEACYAGRTTETEGKGYSEDLVQALTDAIAAGKAELKKDAAEVTAESLTAAAKAITDAIAALEAAAPLADCDLTADMFFTWDAVDATAKTTGQAGCAYDINKSTGMPYGDGTVNEYNYADLSGFDHLAITATEGEPRLLFNRAAQDDHQGPLSVELPRDYGQNKYEAVVDNGDGSKTFVINLKEIVAKDGYAHLHAIKGANWANTTVTEMKLFVGESEYTDVLTAIEEVAEDAAVKDGKYFINGQIVIVKNGVKYNAAGVAIK